MPLPSPAFTVLELLIVVVIIAILVALLLPIFRPAKAYSGPWNCHANLKQLGLALRSWADDHNGLFPSQYFTNETRDPKHVDAANSFRYFQAISNEFPNPYIFTCPADSARKRALDYGSFGGKNISYFIGLEADETAPTRLLSGDRNITNGITIKDGILEVTTRQMTGWTPERHHGLGNILFADGSVDTMDTKRLNDAIANTGLATNRLAMP